MIPLPPVAARPGRAHRTGGSTGYPFGLAAHLRP
jgi:hypothetical protein